MAAAQLITIGTDGGASADQTITTTPLTVALNAASGQVVPFDAAVAVQAKDASSVYWTVALLTINRPGFQISAPGTYRLVKAPSVLPYGAFSA